MHHKFVPLTKISTCKLKKSGQKPHTPKYLIFFIHSPLFKYQKLLKMSILAPNSQILYREIYNRENQHLVLNSGGNLNIVKSYGFCFVDKRRGDWKKKIKREIRIHASWADLSRPAAVEMQPIESSEQLDQILDSAKELSQPIIIDWMAAWCRKCIYLKPKLEKLAAEFDTKLKFYYVDVNKVPQTLVKRGNISKMPTIQLWKDGEMKAEVIGGHKAWLVIEEVREMIKNFI